MGLFKSKEEKEAKKQEKELKKESKACFVGTTLQPIGRIPLGAAVGIKLKPDQQVLNIHYETTDITLPYDRVRGFRVEDETTVAKSGSTIGRALVGGALFGKTGALVGGMSAQGKTKTRWVATLSYEDKSGELQELGFIEFGYTGETKDYYAAQFEKMIQKIAYQSNEDITEL